MSIENLIHIYQNQNKQLIDELSKMPPMVIATAYLHAINYTVYGKDVTEKWVTATEQASALEKAYKKGYYDALQMMEEKKMKPEYIGNGNFDTKNYVYAYCRCPLSMDYAIKFPRIKDGKQHRYACVCEDCGTEVGVIAISEKEEVE